MKLITTDVYFKQQLYQHKSKRAQDTCQTQKHKKPQRATKSEKKQTSTGHRQHSILKYKFVIHSLPVSVPLSSLVLEYRKSSVAILSATISAKRLRLYSRL